ncbi:MAG: U32 family peptidase [Acidobacteria bacterium]|nr:U32 family peptidase [Acidobacteriota bacterium]
MTRTPEILAPAGDIRALAAAVAAGADAVYFGLRGFNARGRAANFEPESALRSIAFLRERQVRSCLTLNTAVFETELPEVERIVRFLRRCPPDAVIFQDLAVLELVRRHLPGTELHASTQAGIHTLDGLQFMDALGVRRVVLARELSFEEIRRLVPVSPVETEVFVFGALCASVSGACYASRMETGRSGNRGACAQVCRMARGGASPFSMKDLDLAGRVADLAAAGVRALKIEGRMKGADYVHETVRAFRALRDGKGDPASRTEAGERLRRLFTRETGPGYWDFPRADLFVRSRGHLHEEIGRVERVSGRRLRLDRELEAGLCPGDRVKVRGRGTTVTGVRGVELSLAVALDARPGDPVLRFPNQGRVPGLEGLVARVMNTPVPLRCHLRATVSEGRLAVAAADEGGAEFWTFEGPAETAPATGDGVTAGLLATRLSSPGCTVVSCAVAPNRLVLRHAFLKGLRDALARAAESVDTGGGGSVLDGYPAFSWSGMPAGAEVLPPVEYGEPAVEAEDARESGERPAVVANHYGQVWRCLRAGRTVYTGRFVPVLNRLSAAVLRGRGVAGFAEPHEARPGPDTPWFVMRRPPAELPRGYRADPLPGGGFLVFGPGGTRGFDQEKRKASKD